MDQQDKREANKQILKVLAASAIGILILIIVAAIFSQVITPPKDDVEFSDIRNPTSPLPYPEIKTIWHFMKPDPSFPENNKEWHELIKENVDGKNVYVVGYHILQEEAKFIKFSLYIKSAKELPEKEEELKQLLANMCAKFNPNKKVCWFECTNEKEEKVFSAQANDGKNVYTINRG